MKWLKRILIVVAVLALILIGGGLIIVSTVDPNDYKDQIVSVVKEQTGRDLTLEGDINLSIFPWLGLELGQTRLSNAEGFGDKPFASIEHVNVRVALLPLFKGTVKADTIELKNLQLNLHKAKDGRTNWDDLSKQMQAEEPEPEVKTTNGKTLALAVGGINIENAGLHWQDDQSGTDVNISPVNLRTGELAIGEPFNLAADVQLENAEPPVTANIQLNAQVTADPNVQRYELNGTRLTLTASGESIPGEKFVANLETDITANLEAGTVKIMPLQLDASGLSLKGGLQATDINTSPMVAGDLKSNEFSPRALLRSMGQEAPQTTDSEALKTAALALAFSGGTDNINVSELNIKLDETTINGNASVASFDKPKVRFMVSLDAIDVDRYLPPAAEAEAESAKQDEEAKPDSPADDKIVLPVDTLRNLDLEGSLKAGKVKVSGLTLNNIQATVTGKNGLIKLSPVTTSLYDGTYNGGATVDVSGNTPRFAATTNLAGVEFGKLSNDLVGKEKAYLRGVTQLNFDLKTQGDRVSTLKKLLGGSLNLEAKDGALQDAELAAKVEKVVAFLKGREPKPAGDELVFDSLTGSANIVNGVANNKDLKLVTPIILAKGEGDIDIGQDSVDYKLGLGLAGGDPADDRTYIPLHVKGPFDDPKYSVDLKAAISGQALEKVEEKKEELKEKKEELIEENKDKLREKLEEKLKFKPKLF